MHNASRDGRRILDLFVDATSYPDATQKVVGWAREGKARYVCAANVHMVMESHDDPSFKRIVHGADLVTPDGVPLVWALRLMGVGEATRVYGPDLTLHVCEAASKEGIPIGLYGGTPESLEAFESFLTERFPETQIGLKIAPPFRPLSREEDEAYVGQIRASGVRILFVGIGCPKQEIWMAEHKDRLHAVMLGVGAAFDFHTGRVRQAPSWIQRLGMEWAFRLAMEPKRLWKRYVKHNPRFVVLFLRQLLGQRATKGEHTNR
jgi:N-acetylglucosaminyldiphosphoundecaprenol N-acetyl-beta-D-mannosaminyltransferase